ncbi:MAG: lysophospholipid acyltransferase family protein [Muribaculaceae bacterium]|nr:lysophospholipid acyltransferase family protein [Muribaculaceae bacterium]
MKNITFGGRALSFLFSSIGSLPLWILYGLADVVAFLAGRIVGYRRKVIRENILRCFPDMTEKDLKKTERDFYRFLGDYFVETLHLGAMSSKEITKRMRFENIEEINRLLSEGKNITIYLGHYCNWEWVSSLPLHLTGNSKAGQIYHPLENAASDYAFLKIRGRFGAVSIDMEKVLPSLMEWRREGIPSIVGYISDQAPHYHGIHYIADFFGTETPTYTGPERLAKTFKTAVYYLDLQRPRRGYYVGNFVKMSDDASKEPPFSLTQQYYTLLEMSIRRAPQYWLWSHRRWKRTREDFIRYYGEEDALRRLRRP